MCHLSLLYARRVLRSLLVLSHNFLCTFKRPQQTAQLMLFDLVSGINIYANSKPRSLSPGVKRYKQDLKLDVQARAHDYAGVSPKVETLSARMHEPMCIAYIP